MTTPKPPSQPECKWIEECVEECTVDPLFVDENGARVSFVNPKNRRLRKIHFDRCYSPADRRQADYILGQIDAVDVVVELKQTDTNIREAEDQIDWTMDLWEKDAHRAPVIAGLIIYGRIEGKKKLPGRLMRANAMATGAIARFLRKGRKLRIEESGARLAFASFLKESDAN